MSNNQSELVASVQLQPLPDLGGAWWTIPETYVWVATRDGRFLAIADDHSRASLFSADEVIEAAEARLSGPPLWVPLRVAMQHLVNAFSNDDIEVTGRLRGEGGQVRVEPVAWLNLELTEDPHLRCVIASALNYDRSAPWFDNLRVKAQDVRAKWSWSQHPAALRSECDAEGLPDRAEITLTDAWAWCLSTAATHEDNGPSRVDWKTLGDKVERKLFDAFIVGDVPCMARLDPEQLVWSPVPADWFRLDAVELHPAQNKLQPSPVADMEAFGPAWLTVRAAVDYRVNVEALRKWWAARRPPINQPPAVIECEVLATPEIGAPDEQKTRAATPERVRAAAVKRPPPANSIDDDAVVEEIYQDELVAIKERKPFSRRSAILARAGNLRDSALESFVSRLTRKLRYRSNRLAQ